MVLGKTLPAYRLVLEDEIGRWGGFVRALRREDREAFEALMDMCRNYASESSCATNPIIFEPMIMPILLGQQKRLHKLEQKLKVFEKTQQSSSIDQANKEP